MQVVNLLNDQPAARHATAISNSIGVMLRQYTDDDLKNMNKKEFSAVVDALYDMCCEARCADETLIDLDRLSLDVALRLLKMGTLEKRVAGLMDIKVRIAPQTCCLCSGRGSLAWLSGCWTSRNWSPPPTSRSKFSSAAKWMTPITKASHPNHASMPSMFGTLKLPFVFHSHCCWFSQRYGRLAHLERDRRVHIRAKYPSGTCTALCRHHFVPGEVELFDGAPHRRHMAALRRMHRCNVHRRQTDMIFML